MDINKGELKKLETEVARLKEKFERAYDRINESGGKKSSVWCFWLKHRINNVEEKIADLKTDKTRIDKILPEEMEIENKVAQIETKLGL